MLEDLSEKDLDALIKAAPVTEKAALLEVIQELNTRKEREQSRQDFLAFVHSVWPDFIGGAHHKRIAKLFEAVARGEKKRIIINLGPRHALLTSEKIPTTQGMKTMANLRVGDFVFGADGKPTQVIGKSEIFKNQSLYKVTTDDGFSLVVDGEHLWTVSLKRGNRKYFDYTTEQLWERQNGAMFRASRKTKEIKRQNVTCTNPATVRLPMLPPMVALDRPEVTLPIDPYVLGVWLGDGATSQSHISCCDEDALVIRAEIEKRGYPTTDQKTKYLFGILGLKVKLRDMELLGCKYIPDIYMNASEQQRRDLLKGLMDTDGCVSKEGQCYWYQSNRKLINQVRKLLASLGIKNSISESEAKIGDTSYGPAWRISFYAHDIAILPRKETRTLKSPRTFGRYIKVEKLNALGDTQCIKVDRGDGLFIAGEGHIITHNTKSEFASYLLPAWFLGRYPKKKIMQISNTGELAEGFGRKVRNLVNSDEYRRIFPEVELRTDSKAAGRWNTNFNGEYFASGVGGTVTGRGADLLIIDDPHSEGDAVIAQYNPEIYDKVFSWYSSGPRQRLQPGGAIVIVMCMTGDTPVLMADGLEKPLRNLRSGDKVATFDNGKLTTTKVNHHRSNGVDTIYKILTQSGRILRANERHPFLVMNYGVLEWTRLKDLKPGDQLVSLKGAVNQLKQKKQALVPLATKNKTINPLTQMIALENASPKDAQGPLGLRRNPANVALAKPMIAITEETPKHLDEGLGITENTKVKRVLKKVVQKLFTAEGFAKITMPKNTGLMVTGEKPQKHVERIGLSLDTELPLNNITQWLQNGATSVTYVGKCLLNKIRERIGMGNSALTITMTPEQLEGFCVMIATLQLDMEKRLLYSNELRRISDFTTDPIVAITPDGEEEVFDVEIDRTENFIANGVVSHNTRWSLADLTGRILDHSHKNNGDQWEVVEFPAILPSGKPLWPEFWSIKELEAVRAEIPVGKWQAQYQQQPTSEVNAIVKREWWQQWDKKDPPDCDFILMSMDTAFEKKTSADYSAVVIFGVWNNPEDGDQPNLILLEAWRERLEFPELKTKTLEFYKEWDPDGIIIEKKATGAPLIYELRRMGIPVQEYTPSRGQDKISRLNAVSDMFASGKVWAPATRWADEVIDEVASFPSGRHDDFVDACTLALARFRAGGLISTTKDVDIDADLWSYRKRTSYY